MRELRTHVDLLRIQLVARSQYRADFWIGISAAVLQHGATLAVLWLVFAQVPDLGGWNVYQAAVLYGFFSLCLGLANLLASGLRNCPNWCFRGSWRASWCCPPAPMCNCCRSSTSLLWEIW